MTENCDKDFMGKKNIDNFFFIIKCSKKNIHNFFFFKCSKKLKNL